MPLYNPLAIESKWLRRWSEVGLYQVNPDRARTADGQRSLVDDLFHLPEGGRNILAQHQIGVQFTADKHVKVAVDHDEEDCGVKCGCMICGESIRLAG